MTYRDVMNENDIRAVQEFVSRVREALGDEILDIRLFGSKVRGEATPDSDIDIAIVVGSSSEQTRRLILDAAFDVNIALDVYISPRIVPWSTMENPVFATSPFLKNIMKEGLPV